MQRGKRPWRVWVEDEPLDLEGSDELDVRQEAEKLIVPGYGINRVEPLDCDTPREYNVEFNLPVERVPVRALSSIEAVKIANAEIYFGEAPLSGAVLQAMTAMPIV